MYSKHNTHNSAPGSFNVLYRFDESVNAVPLFSPLPKKSILRLTSGV